MIIAICGSMSFAQQMSKAKDELEKRGHTVHMPDGVAEYSEGREDEIGGSEGFQRKIDFDLIKRHYELIKQSDAILVLNYAKRDIENYIGGNSFLEIGFAHVLDKKIFLFNRIPEIELMEEEIKATQPIIINGDFSLIK